MKKSDYYSSGEFARMAHISVRTVRYYDKQNILKPSYVNESGARFYSDRDFVRLQQIMLLKYLGFSLEDIRELLIEDMDSHFLRNSLELQRKLIQDKIEQLQMVEKAIADTSEEIRRSENVNWVHMLDLIHLTNMENSLKSQYQNSSNIAARIRLHSQYSVNPQGWFPWLYEQCGIQDGMKILEIGCGNAQLWTENRNRLPKELSVVLSDISEGMIREIRRDKRLDGQRFTFEVVDCHHLPHREESFDLVIANHMLFYCEDIPTVLSEVKRVLKRGGRFICSTYGSMHMKEISELVQEFDHRIMLSADRLYERFGRENGKGVLEQDFHEVMWKSYEDSLVIDVPEPLIEYILSCHGNQNQYIIDRFTKFRAFLAKKMSFRELTITKDAGVFLSKKC
ncbi:MAG: methyltransferase domain-containing protein [Eubacterium sp.]|jgi:Methylase involved in ubiquinone/menaquinone biosynthesis|nr:methyltransferase domain-containing protein [Eubacterium sp.]